MHRINLHVEKIVYYRVTIPFTMKPLLAKAPYPYYDWFTSLD